MKTAVIIHTIADAKHCIENDWVKNNLLFSTHASVDVYLSEYHGVESRCLSAYLTTEEILEISDTTSKLIDLLVEDLDQSISVNINNHLGLRMKWFEPLYSYMGKHHLQGYLCFVEATKKALEDNQLERLYLYNTNFNSFFSTTSNLRDIIPLFPRGIRYDLIEYSYPVVRENNGSSFFSRIIPMIKTNADSLLMEALRRLIMFGNERFYSKHKKTIICDFSYNLKFLMYSLFKKYNLIESSVFSGGKRNPSNTQGLNIPNIGVDSIHATVFDDDQLSLIAILLKDISEDIQTNINRYADAVLGLRAYHIRNPIALGITGSPPTEKAKALCFEYLRSEKVKVLIGQHGCLYGEIYFPWHFNSDFNRCDAFISYGFNNEDIRRLYPEQKNYPEIYPFGYISPKISRKKKSPIDLLFPITNTMSMLNAGMSMSRIPPDRLLEKQVKLLEYLNSLKTRNVYVKLFPYSDQENCAILPFLKEFSNLNVVNNMNLIRFLKLFHPEAVLIEYPSQPLVEVIGLNTEIFLIPDDSLPYEANALEKLKKRVHYCQTVEESILKMGRFFQGDLERKRDRSYLDYYVHKENSKDNIVNIVNRFVESAS